MEWFQSSLSGANGAALQLILITLILVICLVLIVWIFRKITGTPARRAARNRVPRLSITDVTTVDDKRFLVLARRDNVEHLLLIGGQTDIVVESGIVRVQPAQQPSETGRQKTSPAKPASPAKAESKTSEQSGVIRQSPVTAATGATVVGIDAAVEPNSEDHGESVRVTAPDVTVDEDAKNNSAQFADDTDVVEIEPEYAGEPIQAAAATDSSSDNMDAADVKLATEGAGQTTEDTISDPNHSDVETSTGEGEVDKPEDIDSEIAQRLEGALNGENLIEDEADLSDREKQPEVMVDKDVTERGSADDEMQKLLDELSNESSKAT